MKNCKKLLSILIAIVMLATVVPLGSISAFAVTDIENELTTVDGADGVDDAVVGKGTWGGIDWTLTEGGTLTIAPTKSTETLETNPRTGRPYEVGVWREPVIYKNGVAQNIGGWPYDYNKVTKLVIEEGVISVPSFAVWYHKNLRGDLVIPSTVTIIGQEAFSGISGKGALFDSISFAEGSQIKCINHGAFKYQTKITSIEFPEGLECLHAWVLSNCDNLKSVYMPSTITRMQGTNHREYEDGEANVKWGNACDPFAYSSKIETVTFGGDEVKDLFMKNNGGFIVKDTGKIKAVASVGLTYATSLEIAVNYAKSGDTITLQNNTNETVEIPAGINFEFNGYTAPNVTLAKPAVAMIGEQGYETLKAAINACTTGNNTIKLLADNDEEVTINQIAGVNITIDGAGYAFSGTISINGNGRLHDSEKLTFLNVNFSAKDNRNLIFGISKSYPHNVSFVECDFTGATTDKYLIELKENYNFKFEDCNVNVNGALWQAYQTNNLIVDGLDVVNCAGPLFKIDYSATDNVPTATFIDMDITYALVGLYYSNYTPTGGTVIFEDCNITATYPVRLWDRNNNYSLNLEFRGENNFGSQWLSVQNNTTLKDNTKFVLVSPDASVTGPEGLNITTNVEGYEVKYENGVYSVVEEKADVAQVNGVGYKTLQEAINAATAGQTITFLTDINENVTIDKNVVIIGDGYKYTGKIIINGAVEVTVKNINAVKGYIYHNGDVKNQTGKLNVLGCTFANGGYAVETTYIANVNIEDCNINSQSLLYARLSTNDIVVKNVNITKGNYLAYIVTGKTAYFENVIASEMNYYGIVTQNNGPKTITLKNCSIEAPNYAIASQDVTTNVDTFIFIGENIINTVYNNQSTKLVLAAGATLTAPAGLNVTTNVAKSTVEYANGVYSVVGYVAEIGNTGYKTLNAALLAAQAGETVKVIKNIDNAGYVIVYPGVTLDLNGYAVSAQYLVAFNNTNVIDSSAAKTGRLVIAKENVILTKTNAQTPIYDAANGCYAFVTVRFNKEDGSNRFKLDEWTYKVSPYLGENETAMELAHSLLSAGYENSGVKVVIRVAWSVDGDYDATQDYAFVQKYLDLVLNSYEEKEPGNYGKMFVAIFDSDDMINLASTVKISTVFVTDTGAEFEGASMTVENQFVEAE